MIEAICSNSALGICEKSILNTRSRRSSAAMMLSLHRASVLSQGKADMEMGKGGQISSDSLVGVLGLQAIRRSRRRGDAKTMCRHLRHTCDNVCHFHTPPRWGASFLHESNISRRALSWSMSIDTSDSDSPDSGRWSVAGVASGPLKIIFT